MKLCEVNHAARKWDTYCAFHWHVKPGFVQFETGELIYTVGKPDPDQRRVYNALNVQIVSTADPSCPTLLLPDGTPVKKAWLTRGGMQYLAIDRDLNVAVQLIVPYHGRGKASDKDKLAPAHLEGRFAAYWTGPGRTPVGQAIEVSTPLKLDDEQQGHIDSILAQCGAWCAMHDIEKKSWARNVNLPGKDTIFVRRHQASPTWLLNKTFSDLRNNERIELRDFGLAPAFEVKSYEHLKVKG